MSEQASDYCPSPGNIWRVNASSPTAPIFLKAGSIFDIITNSRGDFLLVLETKETVPLFYDGINLFMNAPSFTVDDGRSDTSFKINFKIAPAISVGRAQKTLYCTSTKLVGEDDLQDSEQGVFGAEEDGGSIDIEPPPLP